MATSWLVSGLFTAFAGRWMKVATRRQASRDMPSINSSS